MRRTYITKMPDKAGTFLVASKIISAAGANITGVSFNNAIDKNTLFIDVSGETLQLLEVSEKLEKTGYVLRNKSDAKVILLEFKLRDVSGAIEPLLEMISRYNFNISYMNSQATGGAYQYFKMGLYIENTADIKRFIIEASQLCEVKIADYDESEKVLDDTVFCLSLANDTAKKLRLTRETANTLTAHLLLLKEDLEEKQESVHAAFKKVDMFADAIKNHRGAAYKTVVTHKKLDNGFKLHTIAPEIGANIYILQNADRLLFIDSGYCCYSEELMLILNSVFYDFEDTDKKLILTSSDLDRCGLVNTFSEVWVTRACYKNFINQYNEQPDLREEDPEAMPLCKISKIITKYETPLPEKLKRCGKPAEGELISRVAEFDFCGTPVQIYQGAGGHEKGEAVAVIPELKLVFSGNIAEAETELSDKRAENLALERALAAAADTDVKLLEKESARLKEMFPDFTFYTAH